jgi:DNA-binding response OmpR family regulator
MCAAHYAASALQLMAPTDEPITRGYTSLVAVEPALGALLSIVEVLSKTGFHVTAAESFVQAKPLLRTHSPRILITAARLGMYHGLHLVLHGKSLQPSLAALVTSDTPDVVLQREVEELGATFVLKPIATSHLVAAILQTIYRRDVDRPIRPPFERRSADRRGLPTPCAQERRGNERRRLVALALPEAVQHQS